MLANHRPSLMPGSMVGAVSIRIDVITRVDLQRIRAREMNIYKVGVTSRPVCDVDIKFMSLVFMSDGQSFIHLFSP